MDSTLRTVLITTHSLRVEKYMTATKATLVTYEYLLTIEDEVTLMWSSGLGLVEILFYAGRYSAIPEMILEVLFFMGGLTPHTCRIVGGYLFLSLSTGMVLAQAIVVVRTWAIWNGSRAIKYIFGSFGVGSLVACVYLCKEWLSQTEFRQMSSLDAGNPGCYVVSPYRFACIGWMSFCALDIVMTCLTAIRCRQNFRRGSPRIISLLYRDAFAYFSIALRKGIKARKPTRN